MHVVNFSLKESLQEIYFITAEKLPKVDQIPQI